MASKAIKRWTGCTDWDALPLMLNVTEICRVLRISENTALKLLRNGELPGVKVGNGWRLNKEFLRRKEEDHGQVRGIV